MNFIEPTFRMSFNETITLAISIYAAIISTFVLGWDAYKWLASGPKLALRASMNMKMIGGNYPPNERYISITVFNTGDQPTTIVNLGGMYFSSWWRAYITRKNADETFVAYRPSETQTLPYRFEIGDQWVGLIEESEDLKRQATSGYLFLIVFTSRNRAGTRIRIHPYKKTIRTK